MEPTQEKPKPLVVTAKAASSTSSICPQTPKTKRARTPEYHGDELAEYSDLARSKLSGHLLVNLGSIFSTFWALVSEPGFLKFQIFRFSILEFFC